MNYGDATIIAAGMTGVSYLLLGWGQRATYRKGDSTDKKVDDLLSKHDELQQRLVQHAALDEMNSAELRAAGVLGQRPKPRRGLFRFGLALLSFLLLK